MAKVSLSKAELNRAHDRLAGLRNRIAKVKEEAERTTEKIVRTAEVGGAAFAMGVLQGRTGGVEIVGVPVELVLGVGLNLGGYFGVAGKMSDHLNNVGDGALAAYLTTLGRGVGQEWHDKEAKDKTKTAVKGTRSGGNLSSGNLSAEELARVAQMANAG